MPRFLLILSALASLVPTASLAEEVAVGEEGDEGDLVRTYKPGDSAEDPASADAVDKARGIYSWVDHRGNFHFVDSISLVPPRYRAQATLDTYGTVQMSAPGKPKPELERRVEILPTREQKKSPRAKRQEEKISREARRSELNRQKDNIAVQIARLEEGTAPTDAAEDAEMSLEELENRVAWLETKLEAIDQELAALR